MFTRTAKDENSALLESSEIRRMAKLQQEYMVDHPVGNKVSKLVTVVLQPNGIDLNDIRTEVYMISD